MKNNTRYSRQINLPEIGEGGQKRLRAASVLVVGAGGLGCPALLYLAAAGVGKIGIVDGDKIERSNLHRQVLYSDRDVGDSKAEVAAKKIKALNPDLKIISYTDWLSNRNAMEIIRDYDIVVDGTDNFPARYLINDACFFLDKPFVYGSVYRFEGQVSVFNWKSKKDKGPNYRDLFPDPPPPELVPDCSEAGVLGVLPGLIGTMQATEVIKAITGMGGFLTGRLLLFDAVQYETQITTIEKRKDNPVSGENPTIKELIDYEVFCSPGSRFQKNNEISAEELKAWIDSEEDIQLVDVRRKDEYDENHLKESMLIPLDEIEQNRDQIDRSKKTVLYCQSGKRSAEAFQLLAGDGEFRSLHHLQGGLEAWKRVHG